MTLFKLYLLTLPIFLGIDFIWLSLITKNFYTKNIGFLMRPTPIWWAAILFYLLDILGIVIFAVSPALNQNSPVKALILGALFGLFTYATYDLTNYSTIKDWPLIVVFVDLLWGTFLSAVVALISYLIGSRLS